MMRKTIRKSFNLLRDFYLYFYKGWQARLIGPYAKTFFSLFLIHLNQFRHSLSERERALHTIQDDKIKKLQKVSQGLHSLLSQDTLFTYSALIVASHPDPSYLRTSLQSLLDQSPASLEILIGFTHLPNTQIEEILNEFEVRHPLKIRRYDLKDPIDAERAIFLLAQKATGKFLLLMGGEDWVRPDLLFRYEQILRTQAVSKKTVLFCDFNRLSSKNAFIPMSEQRQELCLPYLFKQFSVKGLLIPASVWEKIETHPLSLGAEDEDLLTRLDLAGALFHRVPFCLYAARCCSNSKDKKALIQVLEKYTKSKRLGWKWTSGYSDRSLRALPSLPNVRAIQVIIPFKDQKELTLKCIHSLLRQKDIPFKITAVDNRSSNKTIAAAIEALGGEVLFIDEPFNYSRLNNLAVQETKTAGDCDVILFLNNDVELEPHALSEMLRWVDQPGIGMVGCRLNYPDGRLQHGGVKLDEMSGREMRWEHIEKFRFFDDMDESKILGITDAVTGACALMKRKTFLDVGGFDEVWYPIGYSDTNLALKLAARGLRCFYTPYAFGIHHESVSRQLSIEDFENSWWLHDLLQYRSDRSAIR